MSARRPSVNGELIQRRAGLLFACFLLAFLAIMVRAGWLQAVRGGELRADALNQQTEQLVIPGQRGPILDRSGNELAVSVDAASVFATPYQLRNPERAAQRLARALGIEPETVLARLGEGGPGFAYIARRVPVKHAQQAVDLGLEGVGMIPDARRVYPEGELAGQVIGAVGTDNEGLTGLEAAEEAVLGASDGAQVVTRDALGDKIDSTVTDAASTGAPVRLAIDSVLQARIDEVMAGVGETFSPAGASAIAMDPRSGEILAMSNWPALDPDQLSEAEPQQLLNRATGFTYEPGSTFKAFTVAGALEDELVSPGSSYDLAPQIQVADRTIGEAHDRGTVRMTVAEILAQSSNVGAVTIGLALGAERFDHWIRAFGFGSPTGIDFPGEESGIVLDPKDHSGSTMGNLPIGQGLAVTPLQMASAYAAIANGGILRPPRLVLERGGEPAPRAEGVRVMSKRTARQLRGMLEGVLGPGGTAEEASVAGFSLAGKTGTSEKAEAGGYSQSAYVGSFVGFAPADRPRLLVAIVVDEPQGSYYGGVVAAPAFSEIARFALPYLGVEPDREETLDAEAPSEPLAAEAPPATPAVEPEAAVAGEAADPAAAGE